MELLGRHGCAKPSTCWSLGEAVLRSRDMSCWDGSMGFPGRQGSPQSCAILLWDSFLFGVLVLLVMVLARLTVILKQYLVTESMTVLLKAVLNSDTVVTAHK